MSFPKGASLWRGSQLLLLGVAWSLTGSAVRAGVGRLIYLTWEPTDQRTAGMTAIRVGYQLAPQWFWSTITGIGIGLLLILGRWVHSKRIPTLIATAIVVVPPLISEISGWAYTAVEWIIVADPPDSFASVPVDLTLLVILTATTVWALRTNLIPPPRRYLQAWSKLTATELRQWRLKLVPRSCIYGITSLVPNHIYNSITIWLDPDVSTIVGDNPITIFFGALVFQLPDSGRVALGILIVIVLCEFVDRRHRVAAHLLAGTLLAIYPIALVVIQVAGQGIGQFGFYMPVLLAITIAATYRELHRAHRIRVHGGAAEPPGSDPEDGLAHT